MEHVHFERTESLESCKIEIPFFFYFRFQRMYLGVQLRRVARRYVFCHCWVSQKAPRREISRRHVNSVIFLSHWCEYIATAYTYGGFYRLTTTRTAVGGMENLRFGMRRMAIARNMRMYTSTRSKTAKKDSLPCQTAEIPQDAQQRSRL